jgi:hypothetical protein
VINVRKGELKKMANLKGNLMKKKTEAGYRQKTALAL